MNNQTRVVAIVALALIGTAVHAQDDEPTYKQVWELADVYYDSPAAACATTENYPTSEVIVRYEYEVLGPFNASPNSYVLCKGYGKSDTDGTIDNRTVRVDEAWIIDDGDDNDEGVTCEAMAGVEHESSFSFFFDGDAPDLSGLACRNGCQADVAVNTTTEYDDFGDGWEPSVEHYEVTQTITGDECGGSGDESVPETPPGVPEKDEDANCTADYYTSPVTGAIVCGTPPQTTTDQNGTETTTETLPDGTEVTTVETPDGTVTETTEYPDGSTQTTTTTPGGDTTTDYDSAPDTGDEEEEEDECPSNQYTLKNGQLVCKTDGEEGEEGSAEGGLSCDAAPSCSGDPIMCAVLAQSWAARCETELPGESEILVETGLDGVDTAELDHGEFDLGTELDTDGFLSVTSCAAPLSVQVAGVSLQFSFDPLCTLAAYISPLVIASGLLVGSRIVVGAF